MNCSQPNRQFWLITLVLAFAIGCGRTDNTETQADGDTSVPVSPQAPQTAGDLPIPGEPRMDTPETEAFPRVEFQTTEGNFTVRLHRDRVPNTVKNFLKYVDAGYYVGTIFHEVIPRYAVVGGNYTVSDGRMLLKEVGGNTIRNEAENGLPNKTGTIGMAREPEDADSARCRFYINLADNSGLDFRPNDGSEPLWQTAGYCAFGEVEGDGLKVLERMADKPVTSRNEMNYVPVEPITIISVRKL